MKNTVSIVIPAYNEVENIPLVYKKLVTVFASLQQFQLKELLFVDDGSKDDTWAVISSLGRHDSRVVGLKLSRNFGHQMALTAGYDAVANADIIISMDADLQDPPELLVPMLKAWQHGAHIVYARRINRQDGWLKKITAHWYYMLLSKVSDVTIPRNVGDFRLIDRVVLNHLVSCREKSRYVRGMVAWTGFSCAYVDFERPNRHAGHTGYTWKKMFRLAFDGMTSFSTFPLKVVGYCGLLALGAVLIVVAYMMYHIIARGAHYQMAAWLSLAAFFMLGVQSVALWLLGEYVGRIYQESQARPLYIIQERTNQLTYTKE